MKGKSMDGVAFVTVALLLTAIKAHAYLDPGYGSFALQAILGLPFLLWLWALIDVLKNEFTGSNKIIWFFAIMIPLIGPILYLLIGTNQKIKSSGR